MPRKHDVIGHDVIGIVAVSDAVMSASLLLSWVLLGIPSIALFVCFPLAVVAIIRRMFRASELVNCALILAVGCAVYSSWALASMAAFPVLPD